MIYPTSPEVVRT